jgi:hypothetical protein
MNDDDDLIPIVQLDYDEVDELIPVAQLFFDDAGPHIFPAGVAPTPRYTPARGRELQNLLGTTITQLGGVSGGTRKTPVPAPPTVPIESLLYRGRAALDRALEIRASRIAGQFPAPEAVEELLDLIALAAEE